MPSLTLSDQKQLVDLNQDKTLFDIEVLVTHKDSSASFEAVILNQTELDSGNINYKTFTGQLKARLTNNKPIYQNYFLCIKGSGEVQYDIKLNPDPTPEPEKPLIPPLQPIVKKPKKESIFSMRTLLILLLVVGIGVGLYYMWSGSKTTIKKLEAPIEAPVLANTTSSIASPPIDVPKVVTKVAVPKIASPNLMNRLHKIASN